MSPCNFFFVIFYFIVDLQEENILYLAKSFEVLKLPPVTGALFFPCSMYIGESSMPRHYCGRWYACQLSTYSIQLSGHHLQQEDCFDQTEEVARN